MSRIAGLMGRAMGVATVLAVGAMGCSGERLGEGSGKPADGGTGGTVGTVGPAGTGGGSGDGGTTLDAGDCPRLLKNGDPCSAPETSPCPTAGCRECIGDVWEYGSAMLPFCVCRAGAWTCPDSPVVGGTIGDCIHQAPFTCPEVQNLYTDATCTVHPPCGP